MSTRAGPREPRLTGLPARRGVKLLSGPSLRLWEVQCHERPSPPGVEEYVATAQIVVPLRGVFSVHRLGRAVVAEPRIGLVFAPGETYRTSHPAAGGDTSIALAVDRDLLDELMPLDRTRSFVLTPSTQLAVRLMLSAARRADVDGLEADEVMVSVLTATAADVRTRGPIERRRSGATPRYVRHAQELLTSEPDRPWRLDSLATAVGRSRSHLAREFAAVTGSTVHQYLLALRLAVALDRISDGERDLSRLAADLGFASHSHLTSCFRRVYGAPPRSVRSLLAAPEQHVAAARS